jgi:uncharacterized coiled-coil protein SlyX
VQDGEVSRALRRGIRAPHVLLACVAVALLAGVAWAMDAGGLFSGASRRELAARVDALTAEAELAKGEASALRRRSSELESQLTMEKGTEEALNRQVAELATENAKLKEDLAFLQRLVADNSEPAGVTIPRLTLAREGSDAWHYAVLVVRGGAPTDDYHGALVLEATLAPRHAGDGAPPLVTLPEDQPDTAGNLTLRFKYYQRVEGTLRVPPGSRVTALTARVYEDGSTTPRASRTLTKP